MGSHILPDAVSLALPGDQATEAEGLPGCRSQPGSGLASTVQQVLGAGRVGSDSAGLAPHVDSRPGVGESGLTVPLSCPCSAPWQVGLPWPGW